MGWQAMGDRNDGAFLALTQTIVRDTVGSTTHERRIAITNVTDIERIARYDRCSRGGRLR
jgi:hypothetical protein